jgi:TonB family protein
MPAFSVLANGYRSGGGHWLRFALEPALPLVVGLWAVGVALLSARTLLGWWAARRLVRSGVSRVAVELETAMIALQQRIGVQRTVRLLRSVKVSVPTVVGWIKPSILLPVGVITALPREQLEMIIAHELAHVRRYDYLVNLLQLFLETLFFFHPAVRWISRLVRQEREHCCDDLVVNTWGQPIVYARALTRLECLRGNPAPPALAATGGDLFARVSRIVQREAPRAHAGLAQVSLITAIALVTSLGAQQGLDAAARHARPATVVQAQSFSGDRLAAIGNGFSRHASNWSAPQPRPAAAKEVTGSDRAAVKQVTVASQQPGTVQAPPDAASARLPDLPLMASVRPEPLRVRREDLLVDPGSQLAGQVSVTPVFTVQPDYPDDALEEGVQGVVKLRFRVDASGRARDIEVLRAEPQGVFDESAIAALERWTFQVNPGHDPGALLAQSFDFSWQEAPELSARERAKDCIRTGTRVCSHPYTDKHIPKFRPDPVVLAGQE